DGAPVRRVRRRDHGRHGHLGRQDRRRPRRRAPAAGGPAPPRRRRGGGREGAERVGDRSPDRWPGWVSRGTTTEGGQVRSSSRIVRASLLAVAAVAVAAIAATTSLASSQRAQPGSYGENFNASPALMKHAFGTAQN